MVHGGQNILNASQQCVNFHVACLKGRSCPEPSRLSALPTGEIIFALTLPYVARRRMPLELALVGAVLVQRRIDFLNLVLSGGQLKSSFRVVEICIGGEQACSMPARRRLKVVWTSDFRRPSLLPTRSISSIGVRSMVRLDRSANGNWHAGTGLQHDVLMVDWGWAHLLWSGLVVGLRKP